MADKFRVKYLPERYMSGFATETTPITWQNWHRHANWLFIYFVVVHPLIHLPAVYLVPLKPYTLIFSLFFCYNTLLGITAGVKLPRILYSKHGS